MGMTLCDSGNRNDKVPAPLPPQPATQCEFPTIGIMEL